MKKVATVLIEVFLLSGCNQEKWPDPPKSEALTSIGLNSATEYKAAKMDARARSQD